MSQKTALVLGGGFAGLSAAIHLACQNIEVTLIEQAKTLGGKASEFKRDGYRFDTGPSVFTLEHVVKDVFDLAGRELPFKLEPLDLLCHYVFPSGRTWDVFQDLEKTIAQLSSEEAQVYKKLLLEAKQLYESSKDTFVYGQSPNLFQLATYGLRKGLSAHPLKTLPQLLDSYGATGDLKQFFMRFATYFGADPYRAPAVLHNICWVELGMGVSYPEGGINNVVKAMTQLAEDLGVTIKTNTKVEKLEHEHNVLRSVLTTSGRYQADAVVSSLDIIRTHQLLGLKTPLIKKEPSLSGFVLLVGVDTQTEVQHHTISFAEDYKAEFDAIHRGELAADPTLYLNVSSKTEASDAPEGHENWFVMANAPALDQHENAWSDEQEDAYAESILQTITRRGLAKRENLKIKQIVGPNKLAEYGYRGSIYGTAPHSLTSTIRPAQKIDGLTNLALAGGSVFPGGGIPLAILSGKSAANKIAKELA